MLKNENEKKIKDLKKHLKNKIKFIFVKSSINLILGFFLDHNNPIKN
jgi:hypothetical protein